MQLGLCLHWVMPYAPGPETDIDFSLLDIQSLQQRPAKALIHVRLQEV